MSKSRTKISPRMNVHGNQNLSKPLGREGLQRAKARDEATDRELLLSINRNIALVKDKKDILQLIYPTLQQLFATEDIFICQFDERRERIVPYLRLAKKERAMDPEYGNLLRGRYLLTDRFFKTILHAGKPVHFSLQEVCQWEEPPAYIQTSVKSGLQECLSVILQNGEEQVGVLTAWFEKAGMVTPYHHGLIQEFAHQMSVLLTNILEHERRLEKERENMVLLAVSHAIASIRDKNDLARAIQKTLQSTLRFSDLAITQFNLEQGTYKVFLESCDISNLHPDFEAVAFNEYPIADGIHNMIMQSEETVILVLDELPKPDMIHIQLIKEAGIQEVAGIRLKHNNTVIGAMTLLSKEKNSFSPADRRIIQEVSHHFATAVVNIIYNEELKQRSKEKESLLSVSSAFSSIRNKQELLPVLQQLLAGLAFYSDATIAIVDPNQKTFSRFLGDESSSRKKEKSRASMPAAHHPFPDGIFEQALHSRRPVIFDLELIVQQQNVPSYISLIYKNGIIDMVGISLRDRNKEIGVLFLFSEKRKRFTSLQLTLVQGIGDQLGTTIANIIANEELKEKEHEKSLLLSFSNHMAGVRNKTELSRVVKTTLKELFQPLGFAIGLVNDDLSTYASFLFDLLPSVIQHPGFDNLVSQSYPLDDGVFNKVLASSEPVYFYVNDLPDHNTSPVIDFWKQAGIGLVIGSVLRVGEQNIGGLFLHVNTGFRESFHHKESLLKSVCSQLSIALSNIVANEKIVAHLNEIERYKEQLEEERLYLQKEVSSGYSHRDIIGQGQKMQEVFQLLTQVAFANTTVLILGETGTGKELIARAIHNASLRKNNMLVKVNCAVLPPSLIESELFGHEKGSFTGAIDRRIGKFELANKGTLFLDEIGELPLDLQVKLLRAIQEKEIERIGGRTTIKIDARIIAATNRDLQKEVDEKKFRRDLFYRLNVFPITLPALRERKEDIPLLVTFFIDKYARNTGKKVMNISSKAMKELLSYSWPGNVRELEHLIERSLLLTEGPTIKHVHLPANKNKEIEEMLQGRYLKSLEENERDHIIQVLNFCNGKIFGPGGAAEILKLQASTLNSKIKKLGIKKNRVYL